MSSRRSLLKGLATMPLASVLADARLARAAAATTEMTSVDVGEGKVSGAVAAPSGAVRGAILLIHEWWGLNDQIKSVAAEFANQGYLALAADLYSGKATTSPDEARALMQKVDPGAATATLERWVAWLDADERTGGRVGTIGWCFGGGWSLSASIATPVEATVVYYGRVNHPVEQLSRLNGPVLGHFATQDGWINKPMIEGFEGAMKSAAKAYEVHWYDAQHGFANPTTGRYDEADAALAWRRTLDFLDRSLAG